MKGLPDLKEMWNKHCRDLPKISKMTSKREVEWRKRWKEAGEGEEYWIKVIESFFKSKFLLGENERGWRANVDFFLRPNTHVRVMEGFYEDRCAPKKTKRSGEEAFSMLLEYARTRKNGAIFKDDSIRMALRKIGGYQRIASATNEQLPWVRKEFMEAFG